MDSANLPTMAAPDHGLAGLSVKALSIQRERHSDCPFPICAWRDSTYQTLDRSESDGEEDGDNVSRSVLLPPINDSNPPTFTEEMQKAFERGRRIGSLPAVLDKIKAGQGYGDGGISMVCNLIDFTKDSDREDYRRSRGLLVKYALPLHLHMQEQKRKLQTHLQRIAHVGPLLRQMSSKLACLADRTDDTTSFQRVDVHSDRYPDDSQDPNPNAWPCISPFFDEIETLLRDYRLQFEKMAQDADKRIRPLDQNIDHLQLSAGKWEFQLK